MSGLVVIDNYMGICLYSKSSNIIQAKNLNGIPTLEYNLWENFPLKKAIKKMGSRMPHPAWGAGGGSPPCLEIRAILVIVTFDQ
jgi:hypothetical protein